MTSPNSGTVKGKMTVAEFLRLPDRVRDALVAEKVMGFEWRRASVGCKVLVPPTGPDAEWGRDWTGQLEGGEHICGDGYRFVPLYTTDMGLAWSVVTRFPVDSWGFAIERFDFFDRYGAYFKRKSTGDRVWGNANAAPLAICIAALLAVGALNEGGD